MAFITLLAVDLPLLTVSGLPLVAPQTVASIVVESEVLLFVGRDLQRREPRQVIRFPALRGMALSTGGFHPAGINGRGGVTLWQHIMPCMTRITLRSIGFDRSHCVMVLLFMALAAIYRAQSPVIDMLFIHNPRVAFLARRLIAVNGSFETLHPDLKTTLGTPFPMASDTILGGISPAALR